MEMKYGRLLLTLGVSLISAVAYAQGLTVGEFTATSSPAGITLTVNSPLSGGSGAGYVYEIYRDSQPTIETTGTPLATVNALPYVDSSAAPDILYFYKIVGKDSASDTVNSVPAGLEGVNTATSSGLSVASLRSRQILNIVYGGDSITAGATIPDSGRNSPPVIASADLESMNGVRNVYFSNQGHSGHTTTDFLPSSGGDFSSMEQAARSLQSANPTGQLVFSLMLGTNDSASSGTNGNSRTPAQITANFETIITQLLTDFPNAKVFVHYAPWYSPNTHNGSSYEEIGLARLVSYFPAIDKAVADENNRHRGHVFVGDKLAPPFFSSVYLTELTPEHGQNGIFYLHPNKQGAADLARLWANAIYQGLYGAQGK